MDRRQQMLMSTMLSVFLSLVCFLLILAISNDNQKTWDLTADKRYSFSPQTESLLSHLSQDVKLYAFVDPNGSSKVVEELLDRYRKLSPSHFQFEVVDLQKKPYLAEQLQVRSYGQGVLEKVDPKLPKGETPRRERVLGFDEANITNSLARLLREKEKTAYFLAGHGERSVNDKETHGYSQLLSSLRTEGYVVKTLNLVDTKKVPEDAALVVVPGPTGKLLDKERELLDHYLQHAGKLFFLADIQTPDYYVQWLAPYGIKIEDLLIMDSESQKVGAEPVMPIGQQYSPDHPITKGFASITAFSMARPLTLVNVTLPGRTGTTTALVQSGDKAYTMPLAQLLAGKEVSFSSDGKKPGRFILAAAGKYPVEGQAPAPEPTPAATPAADTPTPESTRLVVSSSVDAFSNAGLGQVSNRDFCLNSINWLAESENQITVRASDPKVLPLSVSTRTEDWLYFVFCGLIPFLSAFTGILITYFRRRGEKL